MQGADGGMNDANCMSVGILFALGSMRDGTAVGRAANAVEPHAPSVETGKQLSPLGNFYWASSTDGLFWAILVQAVRFAAHASFLIPDMTILHCICLGY